MEGVLPDKVANQTNTKVNEYEEMESACTYVQQVAVQSDLTSLSPSAIQRNVGLRRVFPSHSSKVGQGAHRDA